MTNTPTPPRLWIYLPYVDARGAGMQRYGSEMIKALHLSGCAFELIIGELHGRPDWLDGLDYRVALGSRLASILPRPLAAFARLLWLQLVFPFSVGRRGDTLLALAHELPPFPRIRQVGVAHDLTDFKSFSGRDNRATRFRNALWRKGLKRSARIVAISQATRQDLIDIFELSPEKIEVVHEGVETMLFRPRANGATGEAPYLLYAGTLDPHKNVPFLLEVFVRLRARFERLELKLVGRHDEKRASAMLYALPAEARPAAHFIGFVPDENLAELMAGCEAFAFPSRNEGFGLAPVEAMACGAPVIAAHAGSLPEVIGDGGVLLSPDDLDGWVDELTRVLSDSAYRGSLAARALSRAACFSWSDAAKAYARIVTPVGPNGRTPAD